MAEYAGRSTENKSNSGADHALQQRKSVPAYQLDDTSSNPASQTTLQQMANNSPQVKQLRAYQAMADHSRSQTVQQKKRSEKLIQQKQVGVRSALQMKGKVPVNDDKGLEHDADAMGEKVIPFKINIESNTDDLGPGENKAGTSPINSNTKGVLQRTILTEATQIQSPDILTMEGGREQAAELEVSNATSKMQKLTGMQVIKLANGNKIDQSQLLILIAHRNKDSFTRWPPKELVDILIKVHGVKNGMKIDLLGCKTSGKNVANVIEAEFIKHQFNEMKIEGHEEIIVVGEKGPHQVKHDVATKWWKVKGEVVENFENEIGSILFKNFAAFVNVMSAMDIKSYGEFLSDGAKKPIKTEGNYINEKTIKIEILRRAKEAFLKGDVINNAHEYLWALQGSLEKMDPKLIEMINAILGIHHEGIKEIQDLYELAITNDLEASPKALFPRTTFEKLSKVK